MNILNVINKELDIYQFKFFGLNDFATEFDIEELLDNIKIIEKYYDSKDGSIITYDDFIDYLYLKKYSKFNIIRKNLKETVVAKFVVAMNIINLNFMKYKPKQIIMFLKNNAKDLIKASNPNILYMVFDLAFEYNSACKEIILEIAKEKFYLIVYNFEDIKKIIIKDQEICLEILSDKHFSEVKYILNDYFKVLEFFLNKVKYVCEVNKILKILSDYAIELCNIIDENNALQIEIIFKDILKFFKDIHHSDYIILENKLSLIEKSVTEYLKINGKEIVFDLPLKEILDALKNDKISLQEKLLFLTHTREKGKFISIFASIANNSSKSFVEQFSTSIPHDEYLTVVKQQILNITDQIFLRCLHFFINKNRINDFFSMLLALTKIVCEHYNINFVDLEIETDFNILLNMFMELFLTYESKNNFLEKGLCYSISMFTMALIEKFLRSLYIEINPNDFIKSDWASLGNLLNENNKTIVDLLGIDNVKIFSYYLIQYDNKFGYNYRNNFAHYKNIKTTDMNFQTVLKTTQILLCLINELFVRI